jgi:NAD(P)-dependent dehydrogenase (short-subunit alcohol dehydrogenase family)
MEDIIKNSLSGKVAVVTGASRGIGAEIALAYAQCDVSVVINYLQDSESAGKVASEILNMGGSAIIVQGDVSNREDVQNIFNSAVSKYGRIDILVNNAGYLKQKPFKEITDEDWDKTLDINLKGTFVCSQIVSSYFEKYKNGCIVNLSSVGGQTGGDRAPHYSASKAGIISLTKSFARLLAHCNVRVNAIAPGFIKTDMYEDIISRTPIEKINESILIGRPGNASEVANSVLFLSSDAASYITGHVLNVNGGSFLGSGS